jgi:arsenical pump membrane protein
MALVATGILVLALVGILLRPRNLHESVYAGLGGLLVIVTGVEPLEAAWHVLRSNLAVLAFLAGVLLLAAEADETGLFRVASAGAVRVAHGSPRRLFAGVVVVAFVGTALLSLDATAVALTPVVLLAAARTGAAAEPLLFACIGVANAASLALPVSNPTNVIVTDRLHLGFVTYARTMLPVALAATLAVALVLALRFRRELRGRLRPVQEPAVGVDRRLALAMCGVAAGALIGFLLLPHDLGAVALTAGLVGATIVVAAGRWQPQEVAIAAGPRLMVFALGIFLMVDAVERHGWERFLTQHAPGSAVGVGLVAAGLANVVNNLPASVLGLPLAAGEAHRAYGLLIGVDAGPNLTLSGSLATLLWLTLAREREAGISPLRYLSIGMLTAPAGVAAALVTLEVLR